MGTIVRGNPYNHEQHERTSRGPKEMGRNDTQSCGWCGQVRRVLYKYDQTEGYFCNLGCWHSYHL